MYKKLIIVLSISLVSGFILTSASTVLAYRGDPSTKGPNCTPQRHEAMTEALKSKDYNAWKELMQGKGRVTQVINEDNFEKFAQMHQLRLEGKIEEANQIKTELGLSMRNGLGKGQANGYGRINR